MLQGLCHLMNLRPRFWGRVIVVLGVLFVALPCPAQAFISHWDPREAFFIRQFAYLFWAFAMIYFILALRQETVPRHRGFRWLVWAGVFFALWNLNSFLGQSLALILDAQGGAGLARLSAAELKASGNIIWFYLITKPDHLLLVPAFIFFYLGIRAFSRDPEVRPR